MSHGFDEQDVDVLVRTLALYPDLMEVALARKRARARLSYPVTDHAALADLLDTDVEEFNGRTVERADIAKYVPAVFFPIVSEEDLAQKLLIAFRRGAIHHRVTGDRADASALTAGETAVTVLPGPVLPTSERHYDLFPADAPFDPPGDETS